MSTRIKRFRMHPGLLYFILGGILTVGGLALFYVGTTKSPPSVSVIPAGATMQAEELRAKAIEISRQILIFANDRQIHEPQQTDYYSRDPFSPELWDKWTADLITYSQESKQLYNQKFGGNIGHLRDQFQRWGLSHPDLDMLCMDATNYIVMTQGAIALDQLARQLMPD